MLRFLRMSLRNRVSACTSLPCDTSTTAILNVAWVANFSLVSSGRSASSASVGLAERVPYRGARVPQPSADEIADAYSMRLLLEAAGARAAALNREQAQVEELKRILSRMKGLLSLDDISTLRQLSRQFHQAVIAIGGNSSLDKQFEMVMNSFPDWMLYEYLFRHTDLLEQSLMDEYQEHMQLVEAIELGDADLAERRAIAHIRNLGEDLVAFLGIPHEVLESKARLLSESFVIKK